MNKPQISNEQTYGSVDRPVQDAARVRRRRISEVFHDEGPVPEHVDHVANVDLTHFCHLLTLLVGGSGTRESSNRFREHLRKVFLPPGPIDYAEHVIQGSQEGCAGSSILVPAWA